MTPEQAINLLSQVVAQTRALPSEVDALRQALNVLRPKQDKKPLSDQWPEPKKEEPKAE